MSASTKLSTVVKALCCLARQPEIPRKSIDLAVETGANASKLRQLLSMLVKQGILESIQGAGGGFRLSCNPNQLHLQEIYCAVEDRKAFHLDVRSDPQAGNPDCRRINYYFLDLFADIQVDIEDKMKQITLASIMEKLNKY